MPSTVPTAPLSATKLPPVIFRGSLQPEYIPSLGPIAGRPQPLSQAPPFAVSQPSPPISRCETSGRSIAAQYRPASRVLSPVNHTRAVTFDAIAKGVRRFAVAFRQRLDSVTAASPSRRTRTVPVVFVPESVYAAREPSSVRTPVRRW